MFSVLWTVDEQPRKNENMQMFIFSQHPLSEQSNRSPRNEIYCVYYNTVSTFTSSNFSPTIELSVQH